MKRSMIRSFPPDGEPIPSRQSVFQPFMTVLVNDELEAIDLDRSLGEISSERRMKALGYRFDGDRRLSVAVYLLLKEALRRTCGILGNPRLTVGPNGKPFLTDYPGIHINMSHCSKAAACVVADCPVGIDVEEIAAVDWTVARQVLSEVEIHEVRASPSPDVAFARYWTQKEALVKLSGRGIEDDRLKTLLSNSSGVRLETTEHLDRGYVLTVANISCMSAAPVEGLQEPQRDAEEVERDPPPEADRVRNQGREG